MPSVLGIDPGRTGGMAVIEGGELQGIFPMPKTESDIAGRLDWLDKGGWVDVIALERVHALPQNSVRSAFAFGSNYGFIRGCLVYAELAFEDVRPQAWQRELGCLSGGDKNVTKQKAQQLYPGWKITHSTADAILIATYGWRKLVRRRDLEDEEARAVEAP